jgi:hypothetical protein
MRLILRYAVLVVGIVGWFGAMNALLNRSAFAAMALGVGSISVYWRRRWRTPAAIQRAAGREGSTSICVVGNGTPTVVEFYADL